MGGSQFSIKGQIPFTDNTAQRNGGNRWNIVEPACCANRIVYGIHHDESTIFRPSAQGKEEFPTLSIEPFLAELTRVRQMLSLFEGVPHFDMVRTNVFALRGTIVMPAEECQVPLEWGWSTWPHTLLLRITSMRITLFQ